MMNDDDSAILYLAVHVIYNVHLWR